MVVQRVTFPTSPSADAPAGGIGAGDAGLMRRASRAARRLVARARGVTPTATPPTIPRPHRVYAVGDIHGEIDLFIALLHAIEADQQGRGPARTTLILLGDLIDRGAGSAALLDLLASGPPEPGLVVLKGNHEAALVDAYRGNLAALDLWLGYGGDATLAGFGVDPALIAASAPVDLLAVLRQAIPEALIAWMDSLPHSHAIGDYLFVHAGVRPGVPIDRQADADLLWIRRPFLASKADHGAVIVHGHSIDPTGVQFRVNRIGVDTGAYATGRLSAVGLEGEAQWVVSVTQDDVPRPSPARAGDGARAAW
jgi:serine/threonine protein phosphatase 1